MSALETFRLHVSAIKVSVTALQMNYNAGYEAMKRHTKDVVIEVGTGHGESKMIQK